jgi:hypothetical protein
MKNNHKSTSSIRPTTSEENLIRRMEVLVHDYELIKQGNHTQYKTVTRWYTVHGLKRQNFLKYYHRWKDEGGTPSSLLPHKRGPKWKTRKTLPYIEKLVLHHRKLGNSRQEIVELLRHQLSKPLSPSGVYNVCKRYGMNRLNKTQKSSKRKIVKTLLGELGHIDCHYLPKGICADSDSRYFLVALLDDTSRLTYSVVVDSITSLTVMFATMKLLLQFKEYYGIQFHTILSDNGSEFGGGIKKVSSISQQPFKRLLQEMNINHIHTKPYRPQTNGKIERFWKTLKADLIEDTVFESKTELEKELSLYLHYYNEHRSHQSLNNLTPKLFAVDKEHVSPQSTSNLSPK